ncbi:carbamoyl-phosphate synthase large subunit [Bacillus fonticola]|uniref:carbamoyl-phosphate synthase large subunit n=1 Tax=Bacillus fonticola TaxID=2728853 RepID=UPI0014749364|nr:carbamoyl-phosphate synthase large subunit [Bacillus fonticola]
MPKRNDLQTILVIGSGPISIGQAAEFDYAGTQACLALREEGYRVILVNSNPATIMTDESIADEVYMEPLTASYLTRIIQKERPCALLPTLGGQTALNLAVELSKMGILAQYGVELLGSDLDAIEKAEDRKLFRELMEELGEPVPESESCETVEEAKKFAESVGYPVIVRPAYTLGGTGGGLCEDEEELIKRAKTGLEASPVTQILVEKSIAGRKELEYEMMRDHNGHTIVVCHMENIDPVGVHTGDSVVVAPSQTLTDKDHQILRNSAIRILNALGIEGGCNVQFSLDPESFAYDVIEVNPRVSRSSALASKATGYPIAKIAAKLAVGYTLDELENPITESTYASYEPALDYVVTKLPRFPFDKFLTAHRTLGPQMKATGEVMAIGRTFTESLLKAVRSLEMNVSHLRLPLEDISHELLQKRIEKPGDERLFYIAEALRRGIGVDQIATWSSINEFFLYELQDIVQMERTLEKAPWDERKLRRAKETGFSDDEIARLWNASYEEVEKFRKDKGITPVYKMVDTCAAEFEAKTPYFYGTYETEQEAIPTDKKSVLILGSGPIRIGQGIEFDYSCVHATQAVREAGYEAIVVNNNPETVSTDYSQSDRLYFEPLTVEDVLHIVEQEKPEGVLVQFGGQTAIGLAEALEARGVHLFGISNDQIDEVEDRGRFEDFVKRIGLAKPEGEIAHSEEEAYTLAEKLGYPLILRPSYVLGGRAMHVVESHEELGRMITDEKPFQAGKSLLLDRYVKGIEVEVDCITDGENVLLPGLLEHVERAGVHSGDSIAVYPPQRISTYIQNEIVRQTTLIAKELGAKGILNLQFVANEWGVYVIEVNPRASRTLPFLAKTTYIPLAKWATMLALGYTFDQLGLKAGMHPYEQNISVKMPVFSFAKLHRVDVQLGPEMKSTGEAIGTDVTFSKALYKGFLAAGIEMKEGGKILFTIADKDKEEALHLAKRWQSLGYVLCATSGTAEFMKNHGVRIDEVKAKIGQDGNNVYEAVRSGEIALVVNTWTKGHTPVRDGFQLRRAAVERGIPCLTSLDTLEALCTAVESIQFSLLSRNRREETLV